MINMDNIMLSFSILIVGFGLTIIGQVLMAIQYYTIKRLELNDNIGLIFLIAGICLIIISFII